MARRHPCAPRAPRPREQAGAQRTGRRRQLQPAALGPQFQPFGDRFLEQLDATGLRRADPHLAHRARRVAFMRGSSSSRSILL